MEDKEFKQLFDKYISEYATKNQYGVSKVPYHTHNNIDSPALPVIFQTYSVTDATVAPTDTPINGTARVLYDATHWRLWIKVNNLWKSTILS